MKLLINEDGLTSNSVDQRRLSGRLAGRYGARDPYGDAIRGPRREVDEATIMQLVGLGFNRRRAVEALNRNQGSLELSVEYLLASPQDAFGGDDDMQVLEQRDADMEDDKPRHSNAPKAGSCPHDLVV